MWAVANIDLIVLCSFLNLYGTEEGKCISLDEAASRLGVERRRIYDIVNVLESIEVSYSCLIFMNFQVRLNLSLLDLSARIMS
jgi:hypothetical protein